MRRLLAVPIAAAILATGCSSPQPPAAVPASAASSQPPAVNVEALVKAAMIPVNSLTKVGAPSKPAWPDKPGAGWVSAICKESVGTADLGRHASFTRTWVDPDEWFVQVSTHAWTRHSGTQMLDRLRTATTACTDPFTLRGQLITFTPEIRLDTPQGVSGFAHCARVSDAPGSSPEKHCYAYLSRESTLTKIELRNGGPGRPEDALRKIAAVAAQHLRDAA